MITSESFSLLVHSFGWAVLHSVWQIALIWLIFRLLRWLIRSRNRVVYALSLAAMAAATLWFGATFIAQHNRLAIMQKMAEQAGADAANAATFELSATEAYVETETSVVEMAIDWIEGHASLVGLIWLACVVVLWIRLLGGWWLVQTLRKKDVVSPGAAFEARCLELSKKLKINTLVRLLESPHVREPLTLGFLKPIILFPTGLLLQLTPAQVEALLLHELAHIRRYDYLINLVQMGLETCFFYHPLFWLISRDARECREFCCDDVVLRYTNDPILYAQTLTNLQITFLHPTTQFTMNATGKSRFTERILRIAGITPQRETRPNILIVMLLPLLLAICSWWPSEAALPTPIADETPIAVTDSVPPHKKPQAVPTADRPKNQKEVGDNLGKTPEPAPQKPGKVAIEATKMNILYIGVDNPMRIAAAGVPAAELQVELVGNEGTITGSNGDYIARVTKPGEVTVRVAQKVGNEIKMIVDQKYRVKRIPDPVTRLAGNFAKGGVITKQQLLDGGGVMAMLENFDFDAACTIVGFEVTILPKEQDPITYNVAGAKFPPNVMDAIKALAGDKDAVFIDDIKVTCPGDTNPRNIGGMAFKLTPEEGK